MDRNLQKKYNFTEQEQNWIDDTFKKTAHRFLLDPLDQSKEQSILKSLRTREYKLGFIGVDGHQLTHSIYAKLGYWTDGKTTLKEKEKEQLALQKEKMEQWVDQKTNLLDEIDQEISKLQFVRKKLVEIEKAAQQKATAKKEAAIKQIEDKFEVDVETIKNVQYEELKEELSTLKKPDLKEKARELGVKYYYKKNKDELIESIIGAE